MIHIYRKNVVTGAEDWIGYYSDWYEALSRITWLYARDEKDGEKCKFYYFAKLIKPHADKKTVVEVCANCQNEIELFWDVDEMGYKAFCPICGERLMLCSECQGRDGEVWDDCDYDASTDSCRFNQR